MSSGLIDNGEIFHICLVDTRKDFTFGMLKMENAEREDDILQHCDLCNGYASTWVTSRIE